MIKKRLYILLGGIFILIIVLLMILRMYEKINSVDCVLLIGAAATICLLIGFILEGVERANKNQAKTNYKISEKINHHVNGIEDFLRRLPKYTKFYGDLDEFTLGMIFNDFEYSQIEKEYSKFKDNILYYNEKIKELKENYTEIKNKINKLESKISDTYYRPRFISIKNFCLILTDNIEKIDKEEKKEVQIWMERLEKSDFKKGIEDIKKKIKKYEIKEKKFLEFVKKHLEKTKRINKKWRKEYERYTYL